MQENIRLDMRYKEYEFLSQQKTYAQTRSFSLTDEALALRTSFKFKGVIFGELVGG